MPQQLPYSAGSQQLTSSLGSQHREAWDGFAPLLAGVPGPVEVAICGLLSVEGHLYRRGLGPRDARPSMLHPFGATYVCSDTKHRPMHQGAMTMQTSRVQLALNVDNLALGCSDPLNS